MNVVQIFCILWTLHSSYLLLNAHAHTQHGRAGCGVIQSLDDLIGVVEYWQTKLDLQETELNNLETSFNQLVRKDGCQEPVHENTTNRTNGMVESDDREPPAIQQVSRQIGPTGLFAATTTGLISLDLRTLEVTALTSKNTFAVAVNQKLEKVYWSEMYGSSRIMRSNFDGNATQIIVPQSGDLIFALAIHEASGHIYFALLNSNEITVCDALGNHCAVCVRSSYFVTGVIGIALDPKNKNIYWGKRWWEQNYLVRADLDVGHFIQATKISKAFKNLHGITFDRSSNNNIYWTDQNTNTIGTLDVNSGKKQALVQLQGDPKPWGIQVDAHNIYFSSYNYGKIQSLHKNSGNLTTILSYRSRIRHLALFSAPI